MNPLSRRPGVSRWGRRPRRPSRTCGRYYATSRRTGRSGRSSSTLGLSGRHDYYTGAVYEAYAAGLGFTVANGGRYDNLLRRFGKELPATGFAIYLERLLSVLPEESQQPLLVLVGGDVGGIEAAAGMRRLGVPVLHLSDDLPPEAAVEYARSVEAAWISYPAAGGVKLATTDPPGEFVFMSPESAARTVLP